jgi:hypothetical protein
MKKGGGEMVRGIGIEMGKDFEILLQETQCVYIYLSVCGGVKQRGKKKLGRQNGH